MNSLASLLNNTPSVTKEFKHSMNDLDTLDITIFNSDNIPNPGLITFTLNGYKWYYMPQKIKTIGSNYVVWHCVLDIYTTFILQLYQTYAGSGFLIKTTRSQYLTMGVLNDDPLIKNFNFNGKWGYYGSSAPKGKYIYSWGSSGVNPVVYAVLNTNTANNSSLTLIPILSKSNTVTITKPGTTTSTNLPRREFVFAYNNGDTKSINAIPRNTNAVCYTATGPGDPGVRYKYAKLGGNPNISADINLGFLELKDKGGGTGLDSSWIANTNGWGNMSYNYSALRNLIDQYAQAGVTAVIGFVCGYGNKDYTDVTKWPALNDSVYGKWYRTNLNGATFDKIRVKYTFERSYLPNVKYGPHIEHMELQTTDGSSLVTWSTVRQEDNNYYSDMAQFYSTWTSGAPTQDFNTAILLLLPQVTTSNTTTQTYEVNNSWANINNLLLNNYSNKVQGLFLGPPVTCFEDQFVFENLADGKKYLTLTMDKDGLPVRNYDFEQFEIVGATNNYAEFFDFLNNNLSTTTYTGVPWWLELYLPKMLYNSKFNFAKYLFNKKFVSKTNNDLVNKEDGYFTFNGTTNFIYLNEYDMPKDCIFQMSGQLPFYNDAFKQYVNSTTNSVNTGYEIAKQNQIVDAVGGVFNYISQGLGAMGAAMSGNIPGALAGVAGAYGSLKDIGVSVLKLEQQKNKIKAHYADQKNVKGSTITNSLMTDVLNLVEWYKFNPTTFVGLLFTPTIENLQALGELITINGFLTEQDTEFAANFNTTKSYIATAPVLFAEEGLNKLINDQKFKNTIPTPYYQNVVHEFLSRVLTMKDMDD